MFSKKQNSNDVHALIMDQIKDVEACLISFESFISAACVKNTTPETLLTLAQNVDKAETEADDSLRRMIDSLAGGAYLPSTRTTLIDIATSCDRVANKCETAAHTVVYKHVLPPSEYSEDLLKIIKITREQFEILEKAISKLFSRFGDLIKNHDILDDIRDCESEVDKIEHSLVEKTFDMDIELAKRIQISELVEYICDLSDIIENIADKIQIMLISRKA